MIALNVKFGVAILEPSCSIHQITFYTPKDRDIKMDLQLHDGHIGVSMLFFRTNAFV